MELYDTIAGLSLSKKMFISASEKGAANGVATLNANGKVPGEQLPSYVDDIVEGYLYDGSFYEDPEHTTEIQGETGKIYVDILTNRSYRWSGSAYVEIGNNDEYTADRALVSDTNGKITASDITTEELATLDDITGNIQEQINGKISSTEKGAANGLATLDANGKVTDTQLPTVTANKALVSDENGITSASSVTSTELGYVSGVTSAIQTQISGKQDAITGAASSITSTDLTASRALMSNASGKVDASAVTATELGYVSGVTSAIQTQIDGKQSSITGAASTIATSDLTASRALVSNSSGKVAASSITSTKLGYLTDVTSNIQSQIDGKQASITGAASSIVSTDLTASRALVSDTSGKVSASSITSTKLGYLTDVTSNIQSQIDGKQASITGAASSITSSNLTTSRALVSNSSGKVAASSITSTKLGYLTDVTSNIQSQIDGKQASITGAASSITSSNLTTSRALISDSSGKVAVSSITSTKLGYLSGVTSSIQTQLDGKASTSDLSTLQSYLCRAGLRFKNLGTSFTSAQATAVANGDFSDLWNGDYWEDTSQSITWRIVDNTNFMKNRCTGTSTGKITANHLIVMPDAKLGSGYVANATSSGYGGSTYRNNYRSTYKTKFTNFFGSSHIMTYEDNLTNSATNRTGYICDIELPQLSNIFGYNPIDEKDYSYLFNAGLSYGQFMLFRLAPQYAQTGDDEWFRDIVTSSNWAIIYSYGLFSSRGPAFTAGFRPFGIII